MHLYSSFYLNRTKHITVTHTHSNDSRAAMQGRIGSNRTFSVLLKDTPTRGSNYSNNRVIYNLLDRLSHSCPKECDMLFFMYITQQQSLFQ